MFDTILDFVSFDVPWWVWTAPSLAVGLAIYLMVARTFGFRASTYVAAAYGFLAVLALVDRRGKQRGWRLRAEREKRDGEEFMERLADRRARARDSIADDPTGLYDDDGFRRD